MDGKKLEYKGEEALKEIERMTKNGVEIQESLLKEILTQNRDTEYLNKYMKEGDHVTSDVIAEFKRCVPVTSYEEILPYIQRIANGEDSSLITGQPIIELLSSSGTSGGERKMMPSTAEDLERRMFFQNLIMPIMNKYVPGLDKGKAMCLNFVRSDTSTTPCGLPVRHATSSYYKSKHFTGRTRGPWNDLTNPDQIIFCEDINQSMYCQLLAGLVYRHQVLRLGAAYASIFLKAISFLESNWRSFCEDIRSGHLSSFITDPGCRSSMFPLLSSPNPHLADEITKICNNHQMSWKGILCQLWPKAKYIDTVITGSMAQYVPTLQHYSNGKLPLVCQQYCTSEGYFGINIKPLCDPADVAYTLLPNMGYFEFLPLGDNETLLMDIEKEQVPNNKLIDLGNVKLGCFYEILVTTFAGLYRYRVGDVLQVVGFYNKAPQFRFMCRQNIVISIDIDKTSEEDLHKSVTVAKKLLEPHDALLLEYTSYPDSSSAPGHYVLYWEILHHSSKMESRAPLDINVLEECCIAVEEQLDCEYRDLRNNGSIGPLEIRVVEVGTFDALLDLFISLGATISQYKTPRGIKSDKALKLLNSKVTASFFSPRAPKWEGI